MAQVKDLARERDEARKAMSSLRAELAALEAKPQSTPASAKPKVKPVRRARNTARKRSLSRPDAMSEPKASPALCAVLAFMWADYRVGAGSGYAAAATSVESHGGSWCRQLLVGDAVAIS
jgi:hypothetical protein